MLHNVSGVIQQPLEEDMSLNQLPENATDDEIENEISFVLVLLETLDDEADDFESRKAEYEQALQDLETRLRPSRSDPQTPPSLHPETVLEGFGSGNSYNLPSRPSVSAASRVPRSNSPLCDNRSTAVNVRRPRPVVAGGINIAAEDSDSTTLSSSSSERPVTSRKRRRNDSTGFAFTDADLAAKLRRTRDAHGASGTSTPTSLDSLEQPERTMEQHNGSKWPSGNRVDVLKKVRDQQIEYERRLKMERDDAEIARSLGSAPSAATSFQSATQARLGADGRLIHQQPVKTEPSGPGARASRSELDSLRQSPGPAFKAEPPMTGVRSQIAPLPRQLQNHSNLQTAVYDLSSTSSDDSPVEITPAQFAGSVNRDSPSRRRDHQPLGISTVAGRQSAYTQPTRGPLLNHQPATGFGLPPDYRPATGNYASTAYQQAAGHRPALGYQQATGPQIPGSWPSEYPPGPSTGSSYLRNSAFALQPLVSQPDRTSYSFANGVMPNRLMQNTISRTPGLSTHDPVDLTVGFENLAGDLHERGWDYMLNDPSKTREELQQLLENIRPDEEIPPEMRIGTPEGLKVTLMEHQKVGVSWLKAQEEGSNKGGILADEMGLGKTIQALALILSRPSKDKARKTTLIIAPVSLMQQWQKEIQKRVRATHRLTVYTYHGQKANKVTFATLATYDIVLTTFGTLAAEWRRKTKSTSASTAQQNANKCPLLGNSSKFYRVIVDEAQCIKNKNTKAAQAACNLKATYRLCMTGTPMMNNVSELYSLIHFLRIPPYNILEEFNRVFKRPLESARVSERGKELAMKALQALLKAILLRRSKDSKIDGKPILDLPPRVVEIKHPIFSEDEQAFYNALEQQVQLQVNKYLQAGKIGRNYSYILVRLLRLRQACCHPHLIKDFGIDTDTDVAAEDMEATVKELSAPVVQMIKDTNGSFECPVCYDGVENPIIFFPCGHDMCTECFARMNDPSQAVAEGAEGVADFKCPECRSRVEKKKVFNFTTFKKVHLPEEYEGELGDILGEDEDTDSDAGKDSGSESEVVDDDDVNSQGDLDDFVVRDDEVEEDSEEEEEEDPNAETGDLTYGLEDEDGDKARKREKKSHAKDANGKTSSKGKDKGKSKKTTEKVTMAQLKLQSNRNAAAKRRYLRRLRRDWITSSKIQKTMDIVNLIQEKDPTEKTLIFSQFASLLDLLEVAISDQGYRYARFDGSMTTKDRNHAVSEFQDNPAIKLMIISLKAGNAGLNLTAASQVIILDPFWNPMTEEQAIDRAHRIGQQRPVYVHRILIKDTVEDRIIALQERKRSLINKALDEQAGQNIARLGVRELTYLFGLNRTLD